MHDETMFDITSQEKAKGFLSNFLNIGIDNIENYISNNAVEYDAEDFIDKNDIKLEKVQIRNLQLIVQHISTSHDECQSLRKFGLLNLQQSLTMETILKEYLASFGIFFDISNKWMACKGEKIDITYKSDDIGLPGGSQKHRICRVAHKIYYDYQINGFFSMANKTSYGGRVHERPEFLHNLKELFKANIIEDNWMKRVNPYLITFKASLDSFAWFSFYNNKREYEEDYFEKEEIKKWLIKKALYVIWKDFRYSRPEIIAYMKPEVIIPPSDFLSIEEIMN
ncbi:hypothetical protein [Desulfosporosinus shakirovi]|uniref:hypothetical protein n=1 Tax=Desulfosporosinus shakirovi TaxID=2885154 RepID=UPI001E432328|nr:hypothetical protein [Desulfosporosinus sp. SRJS8]MCB8817373.1 hypothetical protein [Desulfosporosinus sp. SRJS8]